MGNVAYIGKCMGCTRMRALDAGVCEWCLTKRSRGWAERAHLCRTDPVYAASVYSTLTTDHRRRLFILFFGLPPGMTAPPGTAPSPMSLPRSLQ